MNRTGGNGGKAGGFATKSHKRAQEFKPRIIQNNRRAARLVGLRELHGRDFEQEGAEVAEKGD
jgi:hypothetical protein